MKRNINIFMAVVLTLMLVFGTVPAFALPSGLDIAKSGADDVTSLPDNLSEGEVWVDKSVADNEDGTFTITFRALGRNLEREEASTAEPVDVVLVLDVSGSMKDYGRLGSMETAAKNAVGTLLGVPGNRVAIIKYSEYAELVKDFSTNASVLKNSINFSANGGTNIQNAFFKAQELIANRGALETNKPVIILMSDGEPTYYYNSLVDHSSRKGDGTANNSNRNKCVWPTVKQAMEAKNDGIDIYTIGIGTINNNYAIATLAPTAGNTGAYRDNESFDHKYWEKSTVAGNSADSIIAALAEMVSGLIHINPLLCTTDATKCYYDLVVTDEIGDNFTVVNLPDGVEVDNGVLTWTVNGEDLVTLPAGDDGSTDGVAPNEVSIVIGIDDEAVAEQTYYTNTTASAVFTPGDGNGYYDSDTVTQYLTNNGWLSLKTKPVGDDPGIEVVKTVEKDSAVLVDGEASFDYTVEITNTGNVTLSSITISDVMNNDSDITYYPANEGGSVLFDIPDELEPGESISFGYRATVYETGTYENTVTVSAVYDNGEVSDSDTAVATVKAPGLSIVKSVIGSSVITGNSGTFSYELRIRNDGDIDLENVTVTDVFDKSGTTYEYSGDDDFNSETGVFNIGDLPASTESDLVIQYKVYMDSTGTYKNTATVRGCYQESVPEYGVYAVENGDGNNGWTCLEDSDSATVTVKKKSSPTRPPVTPSDPKPPVIDIPDEPTPEGPAEPGIVIPDEEIPEGPALPQTGGGIDPAMLYGLGALLAGGGLGLRFRRNK